MASASHPEAYLFLCISSLSPAHVVCFRCNHMYFFIAQLSSEEPWGELPGGHVRGTLLIRGSTCAARCSVGSSESKPSDSAARHLLQEKALFSLGFIGISALEESLNKAAETS